LNLLEVSHLISAVITFLILIAVFKFVKTSDLLKVKKTDSKFYLFAVIMGIGFVFFQSILNIIYYQEFSIYLFNFDFTFERFVSLNVLASIFVVPFSEELFFRNCIQSRLAKNYKPFKTILAVSLLFAFIHIPFVSLFFESLDFNLHQAYIALFGGILSGILYYKSKSVIPSIIFHIFWNFTSFALQ
jgi:CAAX protease family protein